MKYTIHNHQHVYCNNEENRPWCDLCGLLKSTIEDEPSTSISNHEAYKEKVKEAFIEKFKFYFPNSWQMPQEKGGDLPMQPDDIHRFIDHALDEYRDELRIGFLRQWLNEDRITDPKKMVTNEQIEIMLGLRAEMRKKLGKDMSVPSKPVDKVNKKKV